MIRENTIRENMIRELTDAELDQVSGGGKNGVVDPNNGSESSVKKGDKTNQNNNATFNRLLAG